MCGARGHTTTITIISITITILYIFAHSSTSVSLFLSNITRKSATTNDQQTINLERVYVETRRYSTHTHSTQSERTVLVFCGVDKSRYGPVKSLKIHALWDHTPRFVLLITTLHMTHGESIWSCQSHEGEQTIHTEMTKKRSCSSNRIGYEFILFVCRFIVWEFEMLQKVSYEWMNRLTRQEQNLVDWQLWIYLFSRSSSNSQTITRKSGRMERGRERNKNKTTKWETSQRNKSTIGFATFHSFIRSV